MRIRTQAPRHLIQAGFTLIELIIVIVILGILAAIALPKFTSLSKSAQDSATKSMASELAAAAAIAYANNKINGASSPAADCSTVNTATYMATPTTDYNVTGGTGPTCTVTSVKDSTSTATFTLPQ